jgi:hypothetical protein
LNVYFTSLLKKISYTLSPEGNTMPSNKSCNPSTPCDDLRRERISARDQMWVTDMNGLLDGLFYVTVYFQ